MIWLKKNLKWFVLGAFVLLNLFIIIESCVPGAESGEQSSWVSTVAANAINFFHPETINSTNWLSFDGFVRKFVGHYSLFFVDGLLGFFTFRLFLNKGPRYREVIGVIVVGLMVAIITECIQLLVPGRAGLITDVAIDFIGYLTPILIGYLVVLLIHVHHKRKASQAK